MKKNNSKKTWKKSKRERQRRRFILWTVKLEPETEYKLRILALQWNMSVEKAFVRLLRETVGNKQWREEFERTQNQ